MEIDEGSVTEADLTLDWWRRGFRRRKRMGLDGGKSVVFGTEDGGERSLHGGGEVVGSVWVRWWWCCRVREREGFDGEVTI